MPVATTAIIAGGTALAGMGMNIGQAVKANKQAKAAGQAAAAASQQMKGIKEQNMFAQVQVRLGQVVLWRQHQLIQLAKR